MPTEKDLAHRDGLKNNTADCDVCVASYAVRSGALCPTTPRTATHPAMHQASDMRALALWTRNVSSHSPPVLRRCPTRQVRDGRHGGHRDKELRQHPPALQSLPPADHRATPERAPRHPARGHNRGHTCVRAAPARPVRDQCLKGRAWHGALGAVDDEPPHVCGARARAAVRQPRVHGHRDHGRFAGRGEHSGARDVCRRGVELARGSRRRRGQRAAASARSGEPERAV